MPPGPETTAAASRLFVTEAETAETARLAAAVAAARALPTRRRPHIQPKQAATMGRSLHGLAAPGGRPEIVKKEKSHYTGCN